MCRAGPRARSIDFGGRRPYALVRNSLGLICSSERLCQQILSSANCGGVKEGGQDKNAAALSRAQVVGSCFAAASRPADARMVFICATDGGVEAALRRQLSTPSPCLCACIQHTGHCTIAWGKGREKAATAACSAKLRARARAQPDRLARRPPPNLHAPDRSAALPKLLVLKCPAAGVGSAAYRQGL